MATSHNFPPQRFAKGPTRGHGNCRHSDHHAPGKGVLPEELSFVQSGCHISQRLIAALFADSVDTSFSHMGTAQNLTVTGVELPELLPAGGRAGGRPVEELQNAGALHRAPGSRTERGGQVLPGTGVSVTGSCMQRGFKSSRWTYMYRIANFPVGGTHINADGLVKRRRIKSQKLPTHRVGAPIVAVLCPKGQHWSRLLHPAPLDNQGGISAPVYLAFRRSGRDVAWLAPQY